MHKVFYIKKDMNVFQSSNYFTLNHPLSFSVNYMKTVNSDHCRRCIDDQPINVLIYM